jgi:hypothetical protein
VTLSCYRFAIANGVHHFQADYGWRRANMKWWADVLIPLMALAVVFLALFKDVIVAYIQAPR